MINKGTKGFTLLEMLFVLSVLSIIILLLPPIKHNLLTKERERRFLEILHYDVLYIQSLAMTTDEITFIRFHEDHYVVIQGVQNELYKRIAPDGWSIYMHSLENISFTHKGIIRKPGNIRFKTPHTEYKLVCPLGKGRCYIVE